MPPVGNMEDTPAISVLRDREVKKLVQFIRTKCSRSMFFCFMFLIFSMWPLFGIRCGPRRKEARAVYSHQVFSTCDISFIFWRVVFLFGLFFSIRCGPRRKQSSCSLSKKGHTHRNNKNKTGSENRQIFSEHVLFLFFFMYGVATISRLLKSIGLFCKRAL